MNTFNWFVKGFTRYTDSWLIWSTMTLINLIALIAIVVLSIYINNYYIAIILPTIITPFMLYGMYHASQQKQPQVKHLLAGFQYRLLPLMTLGITGIIIELLLVLTIITTLQIMIPNPYQPTNDQNIILGTTAIGLIGIALGAIGIVVYWLSIPTIEKTGFAFPALQLSLKQILRTPYILFSFLVTALFLSVLGSITVIGILFTLPIAFLAGVEGYKELNTLPQNRSTTTNN